jgi:hypothetical protein
MAGFNERTKPKGVFTLPTTTSAPLAPITTHGGASAFARSPQADLFMQGVSFMVGEGKFYESASDQMDRFRALIRAALREDPAWVAMFIPALRNVFNIRTASVVAAAEFVMAIREMSAANRRIVTETLADAGLSVRGVVSGALQRADEPAEFVAYWRSRNLRPDGEWNKTIPVSARRGLADAVNRLYTEWNAIKYDGTADAVRMGDVVELSHAWAPSGTGRSAGWAERNIPREKLDLGAYLMDRRHHPDEIRVPLQRLPMIEVNRAWRQIAPAERDAMVRGLIRSGQLSARLAAAAMTWEEFGSWLGRPINAEEWAALIPSMGYMALLRHLKQFDEVGLPDEVANVVAATLSDPRAVARSRQFPYRFLTAYMMAPSSRWASALDAALTASCQNLPEFDGRTLVDVDTSSSMSSQGVSGRSIIRPVDIGALFAVALAVKAQNNGKGSVDLVGFADGVFRHKIPKGASVLRQIEAFRARIGEVGHGTNIPLAARQWTDHKRVVVFTDGQTLGQYGAGRSAYDYISADVPVISFNLGGYGNTIIPPNTPNRIELAGFTDAAFRLLQVLEVGPEGMGELVAPKAIDR